MLGFVQDVGLSIVWSIIGVVLLFVSALAFDALHPLKIRQMIQEGNVAAGLLLGAVTIGMAIIIATAIS
ncbi:MAG: DUF350 domain-containing protein [Chloroflexota bacterium]|nr:DUF350 domain-containing protein [Chloroflexota bacterium]